MNHLSQNKHFKICQTVHGEAPIQIYALQFAHACYWRNSDYIYSYHIVKILIACSFARWGLSTYRTWNWKLAINAVKSLNRYCCTQNIKYIWLWPDKRVSNHSGFTKFPSKTLQMSKLTSLNDDWHHPLFPSYSVQLTCICHTVNGKILALIWMFYLQTAVKPYVHLTA